MLRVLVDLDGLCGAMSFVYLGMYARDTFMFPHKIRNARNFNLMMIGGGCRVESNV
jgi:hypothetical protein